MANELKVKHLVVTDSINTKNLTVDNIDITKNIVKDYTSFEVWATNQPIVAGTRFDDPSIFGTKYSTDTILKDAVVATDIPAGMVLNMLIKATHDKSASDIVVDFGDGEIVNIKDFESSTSTTLNVETKTINQRYDMTIAHTYANVGRYMVKIYGCKYFGIRVKESILSRVFDWDCNFAACCCEMASFASKSKKLLVIEGNKEPSKIYNNITSWSSFLQDCVNLVKATGIKNIFGSSTITTRAFMNGCSNLVYTDVMIPHNCHYGYTNQNEYLWGCEEFFRGCKKLNADISKLLPPCGFDSRLLSTFAIFYECQSLTGTVPAELLWDDNSKVLNVYNTNISPYAFERYKSIKDVKYCTQTFNGVSESVAVQVPIKMGGCIFSDDEDYGVTIYVSDSYTGIFNSIRIKQNGDYVSFKSIGSSFLRAIINGRITITSTSNENWKISGTGSTWNCKVYPHSIVKVDDRITNIVRQEKSGSTVTYSLEDELEKFRKSDVILKLVLTKTTSNDFKLTAEAL